MDDFEKRWERIQQQLGYAIRGDEPPTFSSGRTLFGIKSAAEEKMERFAQEIDAENIAKLQSEREAEPEESR